MNEHGGESENELCQIMGTASNSIRDGGVKAAIVLLLLFATTVVAFAQGQVDFANVAHVNAPISDSSGNRIIGPYTYVAHLFWSGDTNATMDSLAPIGVDASFLSQPITNVGFGYGYFLGGAITFLLSDYPSTYIVAQVRVWNTNYGSTYYEARDTGGDFGFSNLVIVRPIMPPGEPNPLTGLQSFQLQRLPRLSVSTTPTNTLVFSWPTNITSYAFQQNSSLDPLQWTTLTNTLVVVGSQNQVTIPKPEQSIFYRLISQ